MKHILPILRSCVSGLNNGLHCRVVITDWVKPSLGFLSGEGCLGSTFVHQVNVVLHIVLSFNGVSEFLGSLLELLLGCSWWNGVGVLVVGLLVLRSNIDSGLIFNLNMDWSSLACNSLSLARPIHGVVHHSSFAASYSLSVNEWILTVSGAVSVHCLVIRVVLAIGCRHNAATYDAQSTWILDLSLLRVEVWGSLLNSCVLKRVLSALDWTLLCLCSMRSHCYLLIVFLHLLVVWHVGVLAESRSKLTLGLICRRHWILFFIIVLLIDVQSLDFSTILGLLGVLHIWLPSLGHEMVLACWTQSWWLMDHAKMILHHVNTLKLLLGVAGLA